MKKILSFFLALLTILSFCVFANAETRVSEEKKSFDISVVEKSDLYKADKFTKEWNIQNCYSKQNNNTKLIVRALLFEEYVEEGWGPELRIVVYSKKNDEYETVDTFMALVDDVLYAYEAPEHDETTASVFGGTVTRAFLNSIEEAKEVSFRIETHEKGGKYHLYTVENIPHDELNGLVEIAYVLEASNAWHIDKSPEISDKEYKASISK